MVRAHGTAAGPHQRKTLIQDALRRYEIFQELIRPTTMMHTRTAAIFEMRREPLAETNDQHLAPEMFQPDAGAP